MWVYKLRLISSYVLWLPKRDKIWWKYQNYPSVVSYRAIQSFSHTTFQMTYKYGVMSKSNAHQYVSWSEGDDSVNDILIFFFNYHPTLAKNFLNHHPMRSHRMFALLIRSERSFIDYSQPPFIFYYIQNTTQKDQRIKLENESKYGFMYIRYHDDLRSKDLTQLPLEDNLLTCKLDSIRCSLIDQFSELIL